MFPKCKNLTDVIKNFSDDRTCRDYLEMKRWNGTPVCPHCGSEKWYKLKDGKTYKCGNKECYKKYTVTVGTIFENTNIPLPTWFAACYLITAHKKGISSVQLAKDLGVTQKSAWFMMHRIREMVRQNHPEKLEGTVEADETYMSRKYGSEYKGIAPETEVTYSKKRNLGAVAAVKQRDGKIITKAFDSRSGENVKGFIKENVKEGTELMTDEAMIYRKGLDEYNRQAVNHSKGEWVRGDVHTNGVENFWSVMKRGVYGIYHQISFKHLQRYCDEFTYRYNNRAMNDTERFEFTFTMSEGRLKYKDLIASNGKAKDTPKA